uniref:Uncharacterized protein n=1 Tax=Sphaerodactylus townsendi TaxID=933632 RepID=A0ACB8FUV6_9SAUR
MFFFIMERWDRNIIGQLLYSSKIQGAKSRSKHEINVVMSPKFIINLVDKAEGRNKRFLLNWYMKMNQANAPEAKTQERSEYTNRILKIVPEAAPSLFSGSR